MADRGKPADALFQIRRKRPDAEAPAPVDAPVERLEAPPMSDYESPQVWKAVDVAGNRRQLLRAALAAGATAAACDTSTIELAADGGTCTCHTVCVCDVDTNTKKASSVRTQTIVNGVCICDTVCTCHTVCTCNTESKGSSSGSSGSSTSYWY